MKRFALILMVALMASCVKEGPVLNRAKATLYIVDSKSGDVQLKPKTAKLSFKRVSALRYDVSVEYTFKTASAGDKNFSLRLKNVPFNIEGEMYTIDASWIEGIEGSGKINSQDFVFTGVNISGQIGTAADTWISFDGVTHGERFGIDIVTVSESSKDVPNYKDDQGAVEAPAYNYEVFQNDSEMKCEVILSFTGENPEVSFNISAGESHTLKEWRSGDFMTVCTDIEVDFANGNHIAGKPESIIGTDSSKDAPIKTVSQETDWLLYVFPGGYIDRMEYTKYGFSIAKP